MLELTGRKADGWLPTKMTPGQYQASLKTIGAAARDTGRDPGAITPAMLGYVLLGPDEETVQRLTEQPLVRALCVLLPAAVFRELGVEPPLAAAGRGASGFHDFIPTEVGREEGLRIVAAIPPAVVRHYAFCGTPEQVAAQVREYAAAGLRHLVMWNITAFGDPDPGANTSDCYRSQERADPARAAHPPRPDLPHPLPLGRDARRAANRLVLGMKDLAYVLCRRASFPWHGILLNWLSEIGATVARQPGNDGHL